MLLTAPAYNPDLSTEILGSIVSKGINTHLYEHKPNVKLEDSSIPFLPLVSDDLELATVINREKIQTFLNRFEIDALAIDKLCEELFFANYLHLIQKDSPKYFEKHSLKLEYYLDPEEEYETLNVIVKTDLEINEALDAEDLFFEKVFKQIYNHLEGKITFRVEPNGF